MKSVTVIAMIMLAICAAFAAVPLCDASSPDVRLCEVNVYGSDEGVSLHNYGTSDADLKGYTVTDNPSKTSNEGSISFSQSLVIRPGETLTFVKERVEGSYFLSNHTSYCNGESGITVSGNFALKNTGDDVYLFKGGTVVDCFLYGNVTKPSVYDWNGQTFTVKDGFVAVRNNPDQASAMAWSNMKEGMIHEPFDPDRQFDATVSPFLMPETGGIPIYDELSNAASSVILSMYILSSDNAIALLADLAKRGIDIQVLMPKNLPDFDPLNDGGKLKYLSESGADIRLITGDGRFALIHSKCCIIDGETVIVMSENWTKDNLNGKTVDDPSKGEGNRGWGAIVRSTDYAEYLTVLFQKDFDTAYGDVLRYEDESAGKPSKTLTYVAPKDTVKLESYSAKVTPVMSPDSSYEGIMHYISNAEKRVFSEQQSIGSNIADAEYISPVSGMCQAKKTGADVRLLVSTNANVGNVKDVESMGIETGILPQPYLHNKGIVCDDTTLVGSVNWTWNSINNNRETMVAIHSKDVADFFASSFLSDYDRSTGSDLSVYFSEPPADCRAGEKITVTVDTIQSGSFTYSWKLDGEKLHSTIKRVVIEASVGEHTVSVTVKDSSDREATISGSFRVSESSAIPDSMEGLLIFIAPVLVVLIGIAAVMVRIRGGRRG